MATEWPWTVFKAGIAALEAGKPPKAITLPSFVGVLDTAGGSDNIEFVKAVYYVARAATNGDSKTLDKVVGMLDVYLDSPFGADEQDSKSCYGSPWVLPVVAFLIALAHRRGRPDVVAKGRKRYGQPLAARLALASAGCGLREITDRGGPGEPYRGVLVGDGKVRAPLSIALPGRRSWVMTDTDHNNSRDTFAPWSLDNPGQSFCLAAILGVAIPASADEARLLAIAAQWGMPLWGLTAEDIAMVRAYCTDRTVLALERPLMAWAEQNTARKRIAIRRFEHGVLSIMPHGQGGSTAALAAIGYSETTGRGLYSSPNSGGRTSEAKGFECAFIGERGFRAVQDGGNLKADGELPAEVGALLWEFQTGGGEAATLDGKPLDAVVTPAPAPAPEPVPPTTISDALAEYRYLVLGEPPANLAGVSSTNAADLSGNSPVEGFPAISVWRKGRAESPYSFEIHGFDPERPTHELLIAEINEAGDGRCFFDSQGRLGLPWTPMEAYRGVTGKSYPVSGSWVSLDGTLRDKIESRYTIEAHSPTIPCDRAFVRHEVMGSGDPATTAEEWYGEAQINGKGSVPCYYKGRDPRTPPAIPNQEYHAVSTVVLPPIIAKIVTLDGYLRKASSAAGVNVPPFVPVAVQRPKESDVGKRTEALSKHLGCGAKGGIVIAVCLALGWLLS